MGLFGKSKKNNEYNGYQSSKGRNVPKFTSFDNMVYVIVRDISDDQTIEICDVGGIRIRHSGQEPSAC